MMENGNNGFVEASYEQVLKYVSDQQAQFLSLRDDVTIMKTSYNVMQRDMLSLKGVVDKLTAQFEDARKTNWPLLAMLGGLLPLVIGGMAFLMTSFTTNAISPLHTEIVSLQTTNKAHAEQLAKLESLTASEQSDRRAQAAETRVQLGEIEQQFHSVSNIDNLRAAQQERMNSIMWEKSHPGERYPNGTFFPTSIFQGPNGSTPVSPP